MLLRYIFFLFNLGSLLCQTNGYTAAVAEYGPSHNPSDSIGANIRRNVEEYEVLIKNAKKQDVDILVFPECGLTTVDLPSNRNILTLYTTVIPDAKTKTVPCGNTELSDVLQRLSCAAKENSIYVVVNLPERQLINTNDASADNILIFNTNVVFDRSGAIIAKYRKYNLFGEKGFNRTEVPDETIFETDFGVTFGTFICFDILFWKPALQLLREKNIKDIVYPSAWFSELPFLTAVQTQAGWSRAYNINLLASGYSNPEHSSGGSGIYQADGVYRYTVPVNKMKSLIVTRINKGENQTHTNQNPETHNMKGSVRPLSRMRTLKENMSNYTTVLINDTIIEDKTFCHKQFCCTFTIKFPPAATADYYYRMIIYQGPRSFIVEKNEVQICGVAACTTTSPDSCGQQTDSTNNPKLFEEISIKGNFRNDDDTVVIPSNVLYDLTILKPTDFEYTVKKTGSNYKIEMRTTDKKNLLAFGIYGITKSGASIISIFIPLFIINIVFLLA